MEDITTDSSLINGTMTQNDNKSYETTTPWIYIYPTFYIWYNKIAFHFLAIFAILGTFGNTMTIIIIYRLRKKRSPLDPFQLTLAVCDLTVNLVYFIPTYIEYHKIDAYSTHTILCKLYHYVGSSAMSSSR